MMLLSLSMLIGRFHPVLVHLPIGILLLACLFQTLISKPRFAALQPAIPVAFLLGAISALASCISGFLLSNSGDYDATLVSRHQWMGIAVTVFSFALYLLHRFYAQQRTLTIASLCLLVFIMITGHLGGSLTHGADYLTEAFEKVAADKGPAIKPVANVQEAKVYADMVQPLLAARCYKCHGPDKMKGRLRLDAPNFILKGGESGHTVVPGKPGESDLLDKLLLPPDNKDHMPPKEKPQPTQAELALLHWWISTGADFTKKTKELPQTDKIAPVLLALQSGGKGLQKTSTDVPEEEATRANDTLLKKLKEAGVIVLPVAANSNYLSANFVTASSADELLPLLPALQKQLLWLNLGGAAVSDVSLRFIGQLDKLRKFYLNNTAITDKGLSYVNNLPHLQYLNLVGTKVTLQGLAQLKNLKELKGLFLYRTNIGAADTAMLRKLFPAASIDFGGYQVATLAQDTVVVKPQPPKK